MRLGSYFCLNARRLININMLPFVYISKKPRLGGQVDTAFIVVHMDVGFSHLPLICSRVQ